MIIKHMAGLRGSCQSAVSLLADSIFYFIGFGCQKGILYFFTQDIDIIFTL